MSTKNTKRVILGKDAKWWLNPKKDTKVAVKKDDDWWVFSVKGKNPKSKKMKKNKKKSYYKYLLIIFASTLGGIGIAALAAFATEYFLIFLFD